MLQNRYDPALVDEVTALITDTLCTTQPTLRVAGEVRPVGVVRSQFERLAFEHVAYAG